MFAAQIERKDVKALETLARIAEAMQKIGFL